MSGLGTDKTITANYQELAGRRDRRRCRGNIATGSGGFCRSLGRLIRLRLGAALSLIWVLTIGGELVILAILPFLNFPLEAKILTPVMGAATLAVLHCSGY